MYRGYFKDIDDREYKVEFYKNHTTTTTWSEITLATEPVIITQNSSDLFSEIKPLSCTVNILTPDIIDFLYSENYMSKKVTVTRIDDNTIIFDGYISPYMYDQPYAHSSDVLTVECISKLSVLKELDYHCVAKQMASYNQREVLRLASFKDIIVNILSMIGFNPDTLEVKYSPSYTLSKNEDRYLRLSELFVSEANFYDDDNERTVWTCGEVLTEILRYLGMTLIEYDNNIYILDYQNVAHTPDRIKFCYFNSTYPSDVSAVKNFGKYITTVENGQTVTKIVVPSLTKDDYMADDTNVSIGDIYNKFIVNANAYNIETLTSEAEDLGNSNNISGYPNSATWTHTTYKRNGKVKSQQITYHEYQTLRLLQGEKNWVHRYFRMQDGEELFDCNGFDPNSTSAYNRTISPRINTRCAVIQKHAKYAHSDPTPTKLDWSTYITFFCMDDTTKAPNATVSGKFKVDAISETLLEQPVLEYRSEDPLRYSPTTGTSWITFKGDLYYQCNTNADSDLYIVNPDSKYYTFSPVDGMTQTEPYRMTLSETWKEKGFLWWSKTTVSRTMPSRSSGSTDYGKGWPLLKAKLQIGDKYWNGSIWTTTESTFYINYNNAPSGGEEETIKVLGWSQVAPNYDYKTNLNVDNCWAIPITAADNVQGKLIFTLYTPSQLKPLTDDWDYALSWMVLFPVIFMKDLELNYVYTDNTAWYLSDEKEESDLTYTNTIDSNYNREADEIECKINTYTGAVPISKSFVSLSNKFVSKVYNVSTGQSLIPEYQIIHKRLEHYLEKKFVYETTVRAIPANQNTVKFEPFTKLTIDFDNEDLTVLKDRLFVVDSYERNLAANTAKYKFIEW